MLEPIVSEPMGQAFYPPPPVQMYMYVRYTKRILPCVAYRVHVNDGADRTKQVLKYLMLSGDKMVR
jgi:hypothetical protein